MQVPIESIQVVGRYRKDLGDLTSLAKSIEEIGLINPITLTSDFRIVAGERRLRACQSLGRTHIEARVVDALDDAVNFLRAERDENTERKEMTISELVALAKALEEIEKPKAAMRQADTQLSGRKPGGEPIGPVRVNKTEDAEPRGSARDIAGAAVGLPSTSYYKAGAVVDALHHPDPEVREVAHAAVAEMDASGQIAPSYEKVRAAKAKVGQPEPAKSVIASIQQQRRVLDNAQITLSGICYGLKQVDQIHPDITSEEAAQWVSGLSEARRALESLIKRLKERSNARA